MARIKPYIAQFMQPDTVSIFELDAHLLDFSSSLRQQLLPDFADYGVELVRFFVTNLARPDGEAQYEKFKELHFRKYADIAEAAAPPADGSDPGADRSTENDHRFPGNRTKAHAGRIYLSAGTQFRRGTGCSKNEGAGGLTGLGIGIGAMAGVGGSVGGLVGNAVRDALHSTVQPPEAIVFCENCGAELPQDATFCDNLRHAVARDKNICAKCGYRFARAGKFCPKCGAGEGGIRDANKEMACCRPGIFDSGLLRDRRRSL
ncbi:MAG: double zinc ribbon domain-containing protein [Oscillospiraceae bacterium]